MAGPDQPHDPRREDVSQGAQIRTFLIADVRGYTLFTQERGDEAAAKLAAKFADIARDGVEARGGTLLELRGDEALCVFSSTRDAIRAAVGLQERFVEETLNAPDLPLTVGIGLDAGEAVPVQGGYRGGALNLAARLCGQARAGEILASREVTHLARRLDGVRYVDRGTLSLKGLEEPVAVVRVVPEDLDAVERLSPFAAAPTSTAPKRRWVVVVVPIAVVLALVAIAVPRIRSKEAAVDVQPNSVANLDAKDGSVVFTKPLGQRPGASAVGFGSVWVVQPDRGAVARLRLEDGSVINTTPVGTSPAGVAVGGGSVWVTNFGDGTVSRINPETSQVSQILHVGSGPFGIAVGNGVLWVADAIKDELVVVDPGSRETRTVPLAAQPSGVAFTRTGVWVSSSAAAKVARVDPRSLKVTLEQNVGSGPTALISAFNSIWVTSNIDGTVSRIDPATGRVDWMGRVGDGPNALAASAGSVWVANEFDGSVNAIDPATNSVARTISVGGSVASLSADGDKLWLAVGASPTQHRGRVLTVASRIPVPSLDPAADFTNWQILSITNDGLLTYKKVGGAEGATLVPDLASALPQVSPDGLTYRFPLRSGIRYSNGQPVRPEDFRLAVERAFSLKLSIRKEIFGAIDGARACNADPSSCDLSKSIVVDGESVTFHLARPDPDLPHKLALPPAFPVPAGTAVRDRGYDPVPATGPYMIEHASSKSIELVRNPAFREWSVAAQPDGFVDAITWRFDVHPDSAFQQLSAGTLDWMADTPSPHDLDSFQAAHPDQIVLSPDATTLFVGFDVRKPPFNDLWVRQALNYAIDRDHVVELLGGKTSQLPTCQILPPNFQGYEPFCPYTLNPDSNAWSAPDPDRARTLIKDANAIGEKVTMWVTDDPSFGVPGSVKAMQYVVKVLNDLGLSAHLKIVHDSGAYYQAIYAGAPQAYLSGWSSIYPRAGDFIDVQFRCKATDNISGLCIESLDAQIDKAHRLQATDPAASNSAWVEIEHQLVKDAVWAPLTNPVSAYAFSARTENVQVNPQWGILLSRLWVR